MIELLFLDYRSPDRHNRRGELLGSPPIMVDAVEAAHDMDYRTHFERRMRLHDHPVFRAKFQKGE